MYQYCAITVYPCCLAIPGKATPGWCCIKRQREVQHMTCKGLVWPSRLLVAHWQSSCTTTAGPVVVALGGL
jgi:hypothetical protein